MKKVLFLFAALCFMYTGTQAQHIADPTDWKYEIRQKGADEYELIFRVELKDGWHIFSQNAGDDFLIPPSFNFEENNAVQLLGEVKEYGKLKTERMEGIDNPVNYYESKAEFVQVVKVRPGTAVGGEHEYQVCNDNMCLPPKTKTFKFQVR